MSTPDLHSDGIYLSGKFFVIYGLVQVLGIVALEFPYLIAPYLGLTIFMIALLVTDKRRMPESKTVEGALDLPETIMLGQTLTVTFKLKISPPVSGACRIYAEFPPTDFLVAKPFKILLEGDGGNFSMTGRILGRALLTRFYTLTVSPLGFWIRGKNVPVKSTAVRIVPVHRDVPEKEFMEIARRNHLFLGNRLWTRSLTADQYYSSRKFQFSDSLRHIDHKKTAKFSEIMTKSFEELRNHRLIIGLDLGRGMSGEISGSSKHNYYLSAAMALAKHAVKFQDTVDFFAFSQKIHLSISGARGLAPFRMLIEKSETLRPHLEESNYEIINTMTARLTGQRSILVLLTDLSRPGVQSTLLKTMAPVCRKHLSVVLGVVDKRFDLDTQILGFQKNSLSGEDVGHLTYCYWLNEQNQLFQRRISKLGGGSLALSEENWLGVIDRLYRHLRQSSYA